MTVKVSILGLYERGWTKSRIARELGVHRGTVARYVRLAAEESMRAGAEESKPSEVPVGSGTSKSSEVPTGSGRSRSGCAPWHEQIVAGLERGLTAQRIWQDLCAEEGFEGSYDAVKRYCRSQKKAAGHDRVWRMECLPGEEAQVDFGTGYYLKQNGRRRKAHVLRVVLSHSRKGYTEAVPRQTAEAFIRCLENACRAFGGVPQTLVIDNLRAAVTKPDWYEPELTPKIEAFCRHYGTVIMPCRVRKPEHKGKVENSVNYVKSNALKSRVFATLDELNAHLQHWERTIADTRIHGTMRQQVGKRFEEAERPALLPLPPDLFPVFSEGRRSVHRDSYVEVERAYYQVPPEYIGQKVWVRWNTRTVRIFDREFQQIRMASRLADGQFEAVLGAQGRPSPQIEQSTAYWLKRCARLGNHCALWSLEVMGQRGASGMRVLQGLVQMTRKHRPGELDRVCALAHSHGAYRLGDLRRLLEHPVEQQALPFMAQHPLIRDMSEYTELLEAICPEPATQETRP